MTCVGCSGLTAIGGRVGNRYGGVLNGTIDGKPTGAIPVWGAFAPVKELSLDNAIYRLRLFGGGPNGLVELAMDTRNGQFSEGVGVSTFTRGSIDVETKGLALSGKQVVGDIGVTINGDSWKGDVSCSYTLDLEVNGQCITGTFSGTFDGKDVEGPVNGFVRPLYEPTVPWLGGVKLLRGLPGLTGGATHFYFEGSEAGNRFTYFGIELEPPTQAEITLADGQLSGKILAVRNKGPLAGKTLTITFKGKAVGEWGSGDVVVTDAEGTETGRAKFVAYLPGPKTPDPLD